MQNELTHEHWEQIERRLIAVQVEKAFGANVEIDYDSAESITVQLYNWSNGRWYGLFQGNKEELEDWLENGGM